MKISFIIPIYNTETNNLIESIESIIVQKIKECEILLIDDGSTDEAIKNICSDYENKYPFIKYIYQKNSGAAVARNNGISRAKGEFICFVDSDDALPSNYYNNIKNFLNKKSEFLIFDYSLWDEDNEIIKSLKKDNNYIDKKMDIISNILFYPNKMDNFMFGSIWAKIFSRDYLLKNNIKFKPNLRKAQDRMFMLEVINNSSEILYYPIYSYKYRNNSSSITHKLNFKMIDYYYELYDTILKYCFKHNIETNCLKFTNYYIINELLLLTLFHSDNKESYLNIRKQYFQLMDKFSFKNNLEKIKYSDVSGIKEKIKLFMFKNNLIYLLKNYFKLIQIKNNKNSFNK